MYPQETALILLIDDSETDAQAFRLHIAKNPQVRYPVEVIHVRDIDEAIAWLNQHDSPYMICIDIDIMQSQAQSTGTSFSQQYIKTLNRYAPTIWISDDASADHVVRLMQKLGVSQTDVFQKNTTLWGSDQAQFLAVLNEIVSRRSSGRSREIQMDMVRTEERIKAVDRELQELAVTVEKIRAALFEGGSESVVAIALRYSQHASNYADRRQVKELSDRVKMLEEKLKDERTQIKLRHTEFWLGLLSRLGFWGTVALFLGVFAFFIGIDRAIELIKALIAK